MRRLSVWRAGAHPFVRVASRPAAVIPRRAFATRAASDEPNDASSSSQSSPTSSTSTSASTNSRYSASTRLRLASDLLSTTREARRAQAQSPADATSHSRPSLNIPLDARHDFIDPLVAERVRGLTPDAILAEELLDVEALLVATPRELQQRLQEERESLRVQRATLRRMRDFRGPRVSADPDGNYLDEIDPGDHEALILDNPESMRRQDTIDLKQVRQSVRDRIFDLDDKFETQLDVQAAEAEKERKDRERRLEQLAQRAREGSQNTAELSQFNKRPNVRDAEAHEAAEFVKLRENLIHEYRREFGEREGDDYVIEEEEKLYEYPDQPLPPKPRRSNQVAALRPRKVDPFGRSSGAGGRKSSRAHCWIKPGTGNVLVNHRNSALYFSRLTHRAQAIQPLIITNTAGQYDVFAFCEGGGKTGQAGAIQLAVARALVNQEPNLRERLKKAGLLTRDTRKVERKKPGKFKARKSYTWMRR